MQLNGYTSILQQDISAATGLHESTISRQEKEVKNNLQKLLYDARRAQSLETDRNRLQSECEHLESLKQRGKVVFDEMQSEVDCMKAQLGDLKLKCNALQVSNDFLQAERDAMQAKIAAFDGRNMLTQFLATGGMVTALSLAVVTFDFYALNELLGFLLTPQKSLLYAAALALFVLVFTVRGNMLARRICIGITAFAAAIFCTIRAMEAGTPMAWVVSVFFTVIAPTCNYLITEEIKLRK